MKKLTMFGLAFIGAVLVPQTSHAQGITITPQVGFYVPGDDFDALRAGADSITVNKEGAFALGLNVEFGFLRGTVAYASAATLSRRGVTGEIDVGDGNLLAVAGDVVIRPLPRLIVIQPYIIAGGGLRRADYNYEEDGLSNALPENDSDFAFHGGVGADVALGPIAVSAEITDFLSKNGNGKWKQHDAFGFVGLKLRL